MSEIFDDRRKALEEEYFRKKEREAIEKLRDAAAAERAAAESAVAALRCPRCDGALREVAYEDVRIDRCEKCRGIWLDAGELEQLTRRESGS